MIASIPRIVIGAASSGSGKTTVACALMRALVRRGLDVRAGKCGPDYIDPMYHTRVVGAPSRNLDLFLAGKNTAKALFAEANESADIAVVEGVMGYYDGVALSSDASAWDVACTLEAPALLVVDGRSRARSIAAEVQGFVNFRTPSMVAGIILNRTSEAMYVRLKQVIEEECGVVVFGYLPDVENASLESRHLGLVLADEVSDLQRKLDGLADAAEACIDLDAVLRLAASAQPLAFEPMGLPAKADGNPTIAVAYDEAFCFYYEDALRLLEKLGARLVRFSPLRDAQLPACDGLYLGGGYPELHAKILSENTGMLESVRRAVAAGMPTVAECGGFLYLQQQLEDAEGEAWPMVGALDGRGFKTGRLQRFGYVTLSARRDGLLACEGDTLPAHEFHYWDCDACGDAFAARKPQSARHWDCCMCTPTLHAGFPHLYLPGAPSAAARFVRACAEWDKGDSPFCPTEDGDA